MAVSLNISKTELIQKMAEELKKLSSIKPPEWAQFVKTGRDKDRPPVRKDWWYTRAASVLLAVWDLGPVGVSKLRRKYGGRKNRGFKPERFYKAGGNIIRKVLQQLESEELIKKDSRGIHKGRVITKKGMALVNSFLPKQLAKKVEEAPEAPAEKPAEKAKPQRKKEKKNG